MADDVPTSAPLVVQTFPDPSQAITIFPAQSSHADVGPPFSEDHCIPYLLVQLSCENGSDRHTARINRLPPEILSEIFLASLPEPNTRLSHYRDYLTQVLRITHVCGQWRSLGIATPRLWTYLQFIRSSPGVIAVAASWLERSGSQPITFVIRTDPVSFQRAVDLLAPHAARWKQAYIHWQRPRSQGHSPIPHSNIASQITSLPLLERLSITIYQNSGFPSIFRIAPKLRTLSIKHVGDIGEYSVPWKQLEHLSVDEVLLGNCLEMLEQSQDLLTLKIQYLQTRVGPGRLQLAISRPFADIPHICLAFLTTLEINSGSDGGNPFDLFFDHFTFPSLTQFYLRRASWLAEGTYLTLASMLSRSSTTTPLVRIALDIGLLFGRWDRLADILRTTPHVANLELCGSDDDPARTANAFDVLTISDGRCLLPELHSLTYLPKNSVGNYNALATMIRSRREGEKQGTVSGLRSVLMESPVLAHETRRIKHSALTRLRRYAAEGLLSLPGLNG
ncbi:hypothetical protein FIBSPDRAFT_206844 [Athelia psychrophila]|uniref:Uncharacterized protein n=1 Tax=Athelia psychrophila TaxID=1759441 RepID=A0A166WJD8_9AGAM|nr:hypothetical protein FIBSPDRAFT_206844 [Fibularhizoctonia sp. CBS 109695]